MVGRMVVALVNQLIFYRVRTYHTDEELQAVLQAEREADLIADERPITIPKGFSTTFKKRLFPFLFGRLWHNLDDSKHVSEAIADVVVDSLIRLKDQAEGTRGAALDDPMHEEFLRLLCDRTTARMNGIAAEDFRATDPMEAPPVKDARRAGLPDAILKEVGDRLARISGRN